LKEAAFEALNALSTRLDGRLLPLGPNQTTMLFVRSAKRAGIKDHRLHDLQTFAIYQAMSGVASRGLQSLRGYKDPCMTMRYSHLSESYLPTAVKRVVLGTSKKSAAAAPALPLAG
jgi:hypothetical protein